MPERRQNWYNLNSSRRYPLDDKATGTGDDGTRLPGDTLVDCHLRFPSTLGRYAYLSGLTITDTLVTALFVATDDVSAVATFTPLCAVTIQKPVTEHRHYAVEALAPGVGGFVVFGDTTENVTWRASNPAQGLLAARVSRGYEPLPVPTLRKLMEADGLEGVVKLEAGSDLEIVKETITVDGIGDREAMVFRLLQDPSGDNVLQEYLGACDNRPESRTCNKEPIETINGVGPDCDGNINIRYDNITSGQYVSCGGETLDIPFGLDEVCAALPRRLTDRFIGRDLCDPLSSSSSESLGSVSSSSESLSSSSGSSFPPVCASLPYCQNFDDQVVPFFDIIEGTFTYDDYDSPQESCGSFNSSFSSLWSSLSSSDSSFDSRNSSSFASSISSSSSSSSVSSCSYSTDGCVPSSESGYCAWALESNDSDGYYSGESNDSAFYWGMESNDSCSSGVDYPCITQNACAHALESNDSSSFYSGESNDSLAFWSLESNDSCGGLEGMMFMGDHRAMATNTLLGCSTDTLTVPFSQLVVIQHNYVDVDKVKFVKKYTDRFTGDEYAEAVESSLACTNANRLNLIVWDACAYLSSEDKKVTTDLQITDNNVSRNGGIIINYRELVTVANPFLHVEYFMAILDRTANKLRLYKVFNSSYYELASVFLGDVVQLNHWYRLAVETFENPGNPAQTVIKITASGVTNPGWATTTMSVPTSDFQPDNGLYGLCSIRGYTRFSFFQIEERP